MVHLKISRKTKVSKNWLIETYIRNSFHEKQEKIFRKNIKYLISKRILIFLFIIYLKIQISISENPVIILKIKKGTHSIINSNFKQYLLKVIINNRRKTATKTSYDLTEEDNNVTLILNSQIDNCSQMFKDCNNISEINFINFDTSNVIDFSNMFLYCQNLKYINLSGFNTSKLQNVEAMFRHCDSLISLDLSHFDTSHITNMKDFFKDCHSLSYLNISNFNTSLVTNMDRMFCHCSKLTSLDLTHFDTSKVTDMYKMFGDSFELRDLNIANFDTSNVKNMSYMFLNCRKIKSLDLSGFTFEGATNISYMFQNTSNLEYINLINSNPGESTLMDVLFYGTAKNLVTCTQYNFISNQKSDCNKISCSGNWRDDQLKLDNGQCYDNCDTTSNKYDYLSKCYSACPPHTYTIEDLLKCVDICPSSTYAVNNKCEKCHSDCKTCNGPFNNINSNCASCLSSDKYLINGNCINNNNNYVNIAASYDTTNNTLIYNIMTKNILPSYEPENNFQIIGEGSDDVVFQITSLKNQLKALNDISLNKYNLSILDISKCEATLKARYNLKEDDDLIILKKEKTSKKASEKEVQLYIYEPYNKTRLNLSFCEDTNINIFVPAELSEEIKYSYETLKSLGYDMFNLNEPFYQDICTEYTSYRDTDISLSDRFNYIYNNDDTQCQPNCKTSKYSEDTGYLNCSCTINEEVNNMDKKFDSKKIYESFFDVLKYSNYKVLKCYNLVFTKYLITKSIGGIIVFVFILINLGCFIIFIIKGINPLKNKLKLKFENKVNNNNNNLDNINNNDIIVNNYVDAYRNNNNYLNIFYPPRRKSSQESSNTEKTLNLNHKNNEEIFRKTIIVLRRRNRNKIKTRNEQLDGDIIIKSNISDNNNNGINDLYMSKNTKEKIISKENVNNEIEVKDVKEELDNFELNELNYFEAIKLDNRTFIQMYWGLLKREHPILFTFFVFDDYNLIYIKITRFIFFMITDMVMNVFFFSDESMHKLYVSYGKYDFIQQIPQIIYSTIISRILEILLCYLSLTDTPLYQIKNLMKNNSLIKMKFVYKCINIKLIIFFIFTFLFMLFYWYMVSAFCSVYKNTQISFIKDWVFSLILGMLIPFLIYLIPAALRLYSIKNRNNKCSVFLFKLSEIIPIF